MAVYQRLRDLREDSDMTQREVADYLGCSQRVYCNYEHGDVDVPTEFLIKLAILYHTSIDYIVDMTDVKRPYKHK